MNKINREKVFETKKKYRRKQQKLKDSNFFFFSFLFVYDGLSSTKHKTLHKNPTI